MNNKSMIYLGLIVISSIFLGMSINEAFAEDLIIGISFQEIRDISGGGWSSNIENGTVTTTLTGITNNKQFDVYNLQAQLEFFNDTDSCLVFDSIDILQGSSGTFTWTCDIIPTSASGVILSYEESLVEVIDPIITENSTTTEPITNSTTTETISEPVTTESTSGSSEETTTTILATTTFTAGTHPLELRMEKYIGSSNYLYFSGENFTTSEIISIDVTSPSNAEIVSIQTTAAGSGAFMVPAIIETSTLETGDYSMTLSSLQTNIDLVIQWTGSEFVFVGETISETVTTTVNPNQAQIDQLRTLIAILEQMIVDLQ